MAHRNLAAMAMVFLTALSGSGRAAEVATPVAGVQRVRLRVAGIV